VLSTELLKALAPRSEFFDLRALLEKYIDLRRVTQPVADPRLLIGAVGVLSGKFKAFDSKDAEISIDAILASTTLPNLFQAIRIGDEIYWDGLFSQNPPVRELVSRVDLSLKPDEIWIIRINPQSIGEEPRSVEEIEDRRNALAGNLSLMHEVEVIERLSQWLREGRFKSDQAKPITIRWIQMSAALSGQLGYVSKLNRDPAHLADALLPVFEQHAELLAKMTKPDAVKGQTPAANADLSSLMTEDLVALLLPPSPSPKHQALAEQRRAARLARSERVRELHAQGWPIRAIGRELGFNRNTVRAYLRAPSFPERKLQRLRGLIFVTENGTPVSPSNLARYYRMLLTCAGQKSLRIHDLRHTCATLLGERTSDRVIAAILGHTPGTVTARYAKVTLSQMREALEGLYQEVTAVD
jgi:DNA-binding CsgD family transcriptional regulator